VEYNGDNIIHHFSSEVSLSISLVSEEVTLWICGESKEVYQGLSAAGLAKLQIRCREIASTQEHMSDDQV
ncbi:MAG: hypothetical protein LUF04_11440, partial [Bacteroides sp.]|nr:hypothetical protein [Bacteroides sp.]